MWVFSGDVDGIVPVLGSRRWVESLGLPVARAWRAWASATGQVRCTRGAATVLQACSAAAARVRCWPRAHPAHA
jgi:hypothetical protein